MDLLSLPPDLVTNVREETLSGRRYVVVDSIILKHGVLNGSDGPLYYPLNEVTRDPGMWNGIPVTANHPVNGSGVPVSGRTPQVVQAYQIGTVFNDRVDGERRRAELWLDVQNADRIDPRIVPAVLSGKPINVSTGLFSAKVVGNGTSAADGKAYTATVQNLRPDHLAVLLDNLGACSVGDGCGINVNNTIPRPSTNTTPPEGNPVKDQLVSWLTTNCDCWKAKEAKDQLATLNEEQLKALKSNAEKAAVADLTVNTLKEIKEKVKFTDTDVTKLPEFVANMMDEKDKKADDDCKDKTTMNRAQVLDLIKGLTDQEYIALAPPSINKLVETARMVDERERVAVINKLTAHIKDEDVRKKHILKLKDRDLPALNELLELMPTGNTVAPDTKTADEKFLANFFGGQGVTDNGNHPARNPNDILRPSPMVNIFQEDEEVA